MCAIGGEQRGPGMIGNVSVVSSIQIDVSRGWRTSSLTGHRAAMGDRATHREQRKRYNRPM
jgi:hypothetical protein